MCLFITAIPPKESLENESVRNIFSQYNFNPLEIENKSVKKYLSENEDYFSLTKNYCDCDSFLGSKNLWNLGEGNFEKEIKKKRKNGWSEAKIKTWITQKEKNLEKKDKQNDKTEETKEFILFLETLLSQKSVPFFGILLHWYKGGLEDEKIEIQKRKQFLTNALTTDNLLFLEYDTLYLFSQK